MTSTVLLQAQRFARFPPGGSLLVPVSSRRAALAGLALFTPCRRNAEAAHAVAWAATWLLGPRALPGERHTLDPPLDRQTWNELLTAWRKDISAFDEIAVYLRPQAQRPGFGVLLLRRGASLAFIKVARAESKELAAEYDAIRRVRAFSPASFSTPAALLLADLETCSYLALSPMEARRHSVVHEPPLEQITGEIAAALSGLPKPAETSQSWLPMHGDFAPWNLRKSGKQLVLYDWEKVGWGPRGADVAWYALTSAAINRPVRSALAVTPEQARFWRGQLAQVPRSDAREQRLQHELDDAMVAAGA